MRKSNKIFIRIFAMLTLIGMFFGFVGAGKSYAYEGGNDDEVMVEEPKGDTPALALSSPSAGILQVDNYVTLYNGWVIANGNSQDLYITITMEKDGEELFSTFHPVIKSLFRDYFGDESFQFGPFEQGSYVLSVDVKDSAGGNLASYETEAYNLTTSPASTGSLNLSTISANDGKLSFLTDVGDFFDNHEATEYGTCNEKTDSNMTASYVSFYDTTVNDHQLVVYSMESGFALTTGNGETNVDIYTQVNNLEFGMQDCSFNIDGFFIKSLFNPTMYRNLKELSITYSGNNVVESDGSFAIDEHDNALIIAANTEIIGASGGTLEFNVSDATIEAGQVLFNGEEIELTGEVTFNVGENTTIFNAATSIHDATIDAQCSTKTLDNSSKPVIFINGSLEAANSEFDVSNITSFINNTEESISFDKCIVKLENITSDGFVCKEFALTNESTLNISCFGFGIKASDLVKFDGSEVKIQATTAIDTDVLDITETKVVVVTFDKGINVGYITIDDGDVNIKSVNNGLILDSTRKAGVSTIFNAPLVVQSSNGYGIYGPNAEIIFEGDDSIGEFDNAEIYSQKGIYVSKLTADKYNQITIKVNEENGINAVNLVTVTDTNLQIEYVGEGTSDAAGILSKDISLIEDTKESYIQIKDFAYGLSWSQTASITKVSSLSIDAKDTAFKGNVFNASEANLTSIKGTKAADVESFNLTNCSDTANLYGPVYADAVSIQSSILKIIADVGFDVIDTIEINGSTIDFAKNEALTEAATTFIHGDYATGLEKTQVTIKGQSIINAIAKNGIIEVEKITINDNPTIVEFKNIEKYGLSADYVIIDGNATLNVSGVEGITTSCGINAPTSISITDNSTVSLESLYKGINSIAKLTISESEVYIEVVECGIYNEYQDISVLDSVLFIQVSSNTSYGIKAHSKLDLDGSEVTVFSPNVGIKFDLDASIVNIKDLKVYADKYAIEASSLELTGVEGEDSLLTIHCANVESKAGIYASSLEASDLDFDISQTNIGICSDIISINSSSSLSIEATSYGIASLACLEGNTPTIDSYLELFDILEAEIESNISLCLDTMYLDNIESIELTGQVGIKAPTSVEISSSEFNIYASSKAIESSEVEISSLATLKIYNTSSMVYGIYADKVTIEDSAIIIANATDVTANISYGIYASEVSITYGLIPYSALSGPVPNASSMTNVDTGIYTKDFTISGDGEITITAKNIGINSYLGNPNQVIVQNGAKLKVAGTGSIGVYTATFTVKDSSTFTVDGCAKGVKANQVVIKYALVATTELTASGDIVMFESDNIGFEGSEIEVETDYFIISNGKVDFKNTYGTVKVTHRAITCPLDAATNNLEIKVDGAAGDFIFSTEKATTNTDDYVINAKVINVVGGGQIAIKSSGHDGVVGIHANEITLNQGNLYFTDSTFIDTAIEVTTLTASFASTITFTEATFNTGIKGTNVTIGEATSIHVSDVNKSGAFIAYDYVVVDATNLTLGQSSNLMISESNAIIKVLDTFVIDGGMVSAYGFTELEDSFITANKLVLKNSGQLSLSIPKGISVYNLEISNAHFALNGAPNAVEVVNLLKVDNANIDVKTVNGDFAVKAYAIDLNKAYFNIGSTGNTSGAAIIFADTFTLKDTFVDISSYDGYFYKGIVANGLGKGQLDLLFGESSSSINLSFDSSDDNGVGIDVKEINNHGGNIMVSVASTFGKGKGIVANKIITSECYSLITIYNTNIGIEASFIEIKGISTGHAYITISTYGKCFDLVEPTTLEDNTVKFEYAELTIESIESQAFAGGDYIIDNATILQVYSKNTNEINSLVILTDSEATFDTEDTVSLRINSLVLSHENETNYCYFAVNNTVVAHEIQLECSGVVANRIIADKVFSVEHDGKTGAFFAFVYSPTVTHDSYKVVYDEVTNGYYIENLDVTGATDDYLQIYAVDVHVGTDGVIKTEDIVTLKSNIVFGFNVEEIYELEEMHFLTGEGVELVGAFKFVLTTDGKAGINKYVITFTHTPAAGEEVLCEDVYVCEGEFEVLPKLVDIIWDADLFTFDDTVQSIHAHYVDINGNNIPLTVTVNNSFKDAGSYFATAAFANNETDYVLPELVTKEYTMRKYVTEITWCEDNFTFNGQTQEITATFKDVHGENKPCSVLVDRTFKDAGTYTATALILDTNYEISGGNIHSYTMNKKAISEITWSEDNYTFAGVRQVITASYKDVDGNVVPLLVATNKEFLNAGTYVASAILSDPNYEFAVADTKQYKIKPLAVTPFWAANNYIYNGKEQVVEAWYIDIFGNKVLLKTSYSAAFKDAGDYTVVCTFKDADNSGNYVLNETSKNYKIEKMVIYASDIEWCKDNYTYNGAIQNVKATFTDALGNHSPVLVTIDREFKNAGTYTATATLIDQVNYTLEGVATHGYTIAKAQYDMSSIIFEDKTVKDTDSYKDIQIDENLLPIGLDGIRVEVEYTGSVLPLPADRTAGRYIITARFTTTSENYEVPEGMNATLTVLWTHTEFEVDGKVVVSIDSADGIDPSIRVVVQELDINSDNAKALLSSAEEFSYLTGSKVYTVKVVDEDDKVTPIPSKVTVKVLIPEEIRENEKFLFREISGQLKNTKFEERDGYAVAEVTALGTLVISYNAVSLLWAVIALGALAALGIFGFILQLAKKRKRNRRARANVSLFPILVLFSKIYNPSDVSILKILGIACVALLVANVIAACVNPKQPKPAVEPVKEEEKPESNPEAPRTLSDSLAIAKASGAAGIVTKMDIVKHLQKKFGDKVEVNHRANVTAPGRGKTEGLPLADTHYALGDKRVCFSYVYETNGSVLLLLRLNKETFDVIKEANKEIVFSSFPRVSGGNLWYSVVIDSSYTKEQVFALVDAAYYCNYATEIDYLAELRNALSLQAAPVEEVVDENKVRTLKESLDAAKANGVVGLVTKQDIIDHLTGMFGDKVEVNHRANVTAPGRGKTEGLPLADTHYVLGEKRVCFVYVYETNGSCLLLLRLDKESYEAIKEAKHDITFSAFPRVSGGNLWYSVVIDASYVKEVVYALVDAAYYCNGGVYAGEGDASLALRDSLALAAKVSVSGVVSKQSIIDYLSSKYSEEVLQLNHRANYTAPGRGKTEGLPLADTHYVLGEKKVCFVYVYEDKDAKVLLLIKAPKEYIEELKKTHKNIVKSKFPKAVSDDWYSAAIDDSYTAEDVYGILDYLIGLISEQKEEVKEVVIEEVKPVIEEVKVEKKYETYKTIDALSADKLITDEIAEEDVKVNEEEVVKEKGAIINVDILGQYFNNGEDVTLKEIKKRVPNFNKNVTYIKVLGRGTLSKKLNVYAYDFSPVAIKMILLAGGQVFSSKAKKNIKE